MKLINKTDVTFSGANGKYTVVAKIEGKSMKVGDLRINASSNGEPKFVVAALGSKEHKFRSSDEVKAYVANTVNLAKSKKVAAKTQPGKNVKIAFKETGAGTLTVLKKNTAGAVSLVGTIKTASNGQSVLGVVGQDKDFVFSSVDKAKNFVNKKFRVAQRQQHNGVKLVPVDRGRVWEVEVGRQKVGEIFKKKSGGYMGITENGADVREFADIDEATNFFADVKVMASKKSRKTQAFSASGISVVANSQGNTWKVVAKHLNKNITIGAVKRVSGGFKAISYIQDGERQSFATLEKATQFVTAGYRKEKNI